MNIFISYSTDSQDLVNKIANYLSPLATVPFWEQSKVLGEKDWELIFEWIDDSDIVLAVITDKTISRAMAVGQEIGYAKDADKFIIPIVTQNVKETDLGFLKGITYQRISNDNPGPALSALESRIGDWRRTDLMKNVAIFLGIVALIWLVSRE